MAQNSTIPIAKREAMGIRGRHGYDVWEAFVSWEEDKQRDFLSRRGVPESRLSETLSELIEVLHAENIRQD